MESSREELFKLIQQKVREGTFEHVLKDFQTRLDLSFEYIPSSPPNLCLKDAEEVRDECKTTFVLKDLTHYLAAIGVNKNNFRIEEIPIPKDAVTFWKLVSKGKS